MKKLLLTLLPVLGFAQEKIQMEFGRNFKDPSKTVKSIEVVDLRTDKGAPTINYKGDAYTFEFPQDFGTQAQAKFDKDNKTKGARDIVVLFEDFSVTEFNNGKKVVPLGHIRASAFEKKNGQYYYLHTLDKNIGTLEMQNAMTPKYLPAFLDIDVADFLKTAYSKTPSAMALGQDQLSNYYNILSAGMPAFNQNLKDGVYETNTAFFNQTPSEGYVLEKNKDGKVTRARKGDEKIPAYKIYAYVEGGKAYKNTFSGFLPMLKDDKGYYLYSNRGELEMIPANSTMGMFGLIGGIAAAVEQDAKQDKARKAEKKNIYVDPLTGSYIY